MTFNQAIKNIAISDIRQFDREVSEIDGIIKLTLGEPNFNTPDHIKKAAIKAIHANQSHYTQTAGLDTLREATVRYFHDKFQLNYAPSQVITTVGATEALAATFQTLLNDGDTVLIPTPVFPIYTPLTEINGGKVVMLDTRDDGFVLQADALKKALSQQKAKALVLVYPSNPTGVTYSKDQLEALADVIKEYPDLWVICDEVYAELTYEGTHTSLATLLPEQTVLVSGLSKSHAMTGWRIGFLFGPQHFINEVMKSHQYMITSATTISQFAALEAMLHGHEDCQIMKNDYILRRDFMANALREIGFEVASPDGAFYLFVKIPPHCPQQSWDFVRELAYQAKVALIPGISFGSGGEGYVRLSYAASMEDLQEAAKRIAVYVQSKPKE